MQFGFPKIRRQFGKAFGDFPLIHSNDFILIPIDSEPKSLTLTSWMTFKVSKMPIKPKLIATHFYSTELPNEETKKALNEFILKNPIEIKYLKTNQPNSLFEMYQIYCNYAIELNCNKVALPDSLDFLNAQLLGTMFSEGVFNGPSVIQKVQITPESSEISLIRPFCYVSDEDIKPFVEKNSLPSISNAINIPENQFSKVAREAIIYMSSESNNIRMNIFHSQFSIQEKYLGTGDGKIQDMCNAEDECP